MHYIGIEFQDGSRAFRNDLPFRLDGIPNPVHCLVLVRAYLDNNDQEDPHRHAPDFRLDRSFCGQVLIKRTDRQEPEKVMIQDGEGAVMLSSQVPTNTTLCCLPDPQGLHLPRYDQEVLLAEWR